MLNFVRRKHDERLRMIWNKGVARFEHALNQREPIGYSRPLVHVTELYEVTSEIPFTGPFLEDNGQPARLPDGSLLTTHMIDGYAIDGLWLGHDMHAALLYLWRVSTPHQLTLPHPVKLVPVYRVDATMVKIITQASQWNIIPTVGDYYVDHYFRKPREFAEIYRMEPQALSRLLAA